MKILIYSNEDLRKDGLFKKKNNIKEFNEEEFIEYLKNNNLSVSKGYIDITGYISNGKQFRCSYNGTLIGVTSIIDKFNEVKK